MVVDYCTMCDYALASFVALVYTYLFHLLCETSHSCSCKVPFEPFLEANQYGAMRVTLLD